METGHALVEMPSKLRAPNRHAGRSISDVEHAPGRTRPADNGEIAYVRRSRQRRIPD
jgi:hypothetical protein